MSGEEQQEASMQLRAATITSSHSEGEEFCPGLLTGFWSDSGGVDGGASAATGGLAVTFPDRQADLVRCGPQFALPISFDMVLASRRCCSLGGR